MFHVSTPVDADRPRRAPGAVALHDRRIAVAGTPAQYLEAGSGPPLLLVHGHEQSATSWRWVIPALARTHRVLAVSLPGYGDTAPGAYAPASDTSPFVPGLLAARGIGPVGGGGGREPSPPSRARAPPPMRCREQSWSRRRRHPAAGG